MRKNKKALIIDEFRKNIDIIFKKNIIFAFLCGSFARDKYGNKGDIDMVVCLKKRNKKMKEEFLKWYFFIHKKTGHKPDMVYGCEVYSQKQLDLFLNFAENTTPVIKINSSKIYSGIVLAGMLYGPVLGLVGDYKKYLFLKKRAGKITKKWKRKILKILLAQNADLLLKKIIKHEKNNIR